MKPTRFDYVRLRVACWLGRALMYPFGRCICYGAFDERPARMVLTSQKGGEYGLNVGVRPYDEIDEVISRYARLAGEQCCLPQEADDLEWRVKRCREELERLRASKRGPRG